MHREEKKTHPGHCEYKSCLWADQSWMSLHDSALIFWLLLLYKFLFEVKFVVLSHLPQSHDLINRSFNMIPELLVVEFKVLAFFSKEMKLALLEALEDIQNGFYKCFNKLLKPLSEIHCVTKYHLLRMDVLQVLNSNNL